MSEAYEFAQSLGLSNRLTEKLDNILTIQSRSPSAAHVLANQPEISANRADDITLSASPINEEKSEISFSR